MIDQDIAEFRELHAAARSAAGLEPHDAARYAALSDRLLGMALVAQNEAALGAGHRPRAGIRSRRALRVDLTWEREVHRAITVDVGTRGFGALLGATPPRNTAVLAKLHLSHRESITLVARVVGSRERRGTARVAFAVTDMGDEDRVRLERLILDDALAEARFSATAASRSIG
jgi:hypothetical protein